jgi:hypothetical protein
MAGLQQRQRGLRGAEVRVTRRRSDPSLPPLPSRFESRTEQVKIRVSVREKDQLQRMRPDLTTAAIVSLLVDDVLTGRYQPPWSVEVSTDDASETETDQ